MIDPNNSTIMQCVQDQQKYITQLHSELLHQKDEIANLRSIVSELQATVRQKEPKVFAATKWLVLRHSVPKDFCNLRSYNNISELITLEDEDGNLITGSDVPLKLTLKYEDGSIVENQRILTGGTGLKIDSSGKAIMKCRIEELSSEHKKKKFVIEVSPDVRKYPQNSDVESTRTAPIRVLRRDRSKGNGDKPERILDSSSTYGKNKRELHNAHDDEHLHKALRVETPLTASSLQYCQNKTIVADSSPNQWRETLHAGEEAWDNIFSQIDSFIFTPPGCQEDSMLASTDNSDQSLSNSWEESSGFDDCESVSSSIS